MDGIVGKQTNIAIGAFHASFTRSSEKDFPGRVGVHAVQRQEQVKPRKKARKVQEMQFAQAAPEEEGQEEERVTSKLASPETLIKPPCHAPAIFPANPARLRATFN
ncbi:MAG: hypothetical protein HY544_00240 [Candidatus Diapherotrites archaeon]|uniref:Uncharacterized protein n=1 Tax=Candidatus Iainarchaeum sp. TaxID=3101447 RepID=A0A8T3YKT9_9ARCH|nr:hypothetical protein [Candidatus Diapherotrites archaeon]